MNWMASIAAVFKLQIGKGLESQLTVNQKISYVTLMPELSLLKIKDKIHLKLLNEMNLICFYRNVSVCGCMPHQI